MLLTTVIALIFVTPARAADDPPKPEATEKPASEILVEDAERREEIKNINIQSSLKRCLNEHDNEGSKKTYSRKEIEDYCGCFAVLINERVTNDEWLANLKAGTWGKNPKLIATVKYCRETYKGLPDVKALRAKKW